MTSDLTIFSIRLLFCFPLARTLLSSRPRWMILGLSGKIAMIIDENVFNMQLCKSMQKRYGVSIQKQRIELMHSIRPRDHHHRAKYPSYIQSSWVLVRRGPGK